MDIFSKEKPDLSQLELEPQPDTGNISADELGKMAKGENQLYDLLKEHFHTVRTMIVASAAIASANLLALQALQDIGISNWFLGSIASLYLATIVFVLYLTLSINIQTSVIIQQNDFVNNATKITNDDLTKNSNVGKEFLSQAEAHFKKLTSKVANMDRASKLLITGNVLFIVGLLIPIIGFLRLLIL